MKLSKFFTQCSKGKYINLGHSICKITGKGFSRWNSMFTVKLKIVKVLDKQELQKDINSYPISFSKCGVGGIHNDWELSMEDEIHDDITLALLE